MGSSESIGNQPRPTSPITLLKNIHPPTTVRFAPSTHTSKASALRPCKGVLILFGGSREFVTPLADNPPKVLPPRNCRSTITREYMLEGKIAEGLKAVSARNRNICLIPFATSYIVMKRRPLELASTSLNRQRAPSSSFASNTSSILHAGDGPRLVVRSQSAP